MMNCREFGIDFSRSSREFGVLMNATPLAGFLAVCSLVCVGCETSSGPSDLTGTSGTNAATTSQNTNAFGFLVTNYPPLEQWMDERFKVRYENMPLNMVFEQQPIADIRYQLENLPPSTPVFNLVSSSISRREILKEISDFFNVDMTVQMANGQPSHVTVRGRQAGGFVPPVAAGPTLSATQPPAPSPGTASSTGALQ